MSKDLSNERIKDTYQRVVQVSPAPSGSSTPRLYDLTGEEIKGIRFQEAFERDENGDLQPTQGAFFDMFWEEDDEGNKIPRDIKFWLDANFNVTPVPKE